MEITHEPQTTQVVGRQAEACEKTGLWVLLPFKVTAEKQALIGGELLTEDNLRAPARQGGTPG